MDIRSAKRSWARALPWALTVVCAAGLVSPVWAGEEIDEKLEMGFKVVPKDGLAIVTADRNAKGKFFTFFDFHPSQFKNTDTDKNWNTNVVDPATTTHSYTLDETHGTKGSATHTLEITNAFVTVGSQQVPVPVLTDFVTAKVVPGKGDAGAKVGVEATLQDPWVFSDTSVDANAAYKSSGLTIPVSLNAGTAFPDQFADPLDPKSPGAVASLTSMRVRARVAPGVITDASAFWSSPTGAVDLFTLLLTSDESYNITALITPGSDTSNFTLDFANLAGAPAAISAAFTNGEMLSDLEDIFSVGFTPSGAVTEYTFGIETDVNVVANEIPEPTTGLILVAGSALCMVRRRRRR